MVLHYTSLNRFCILSVEQDNIFPMNFICSCTRIDNTGYILIF